jgi:pimeloyl-ACP methyl ester carboxylesterase
LLYGENSDVLDRAFVLEDSIPDSSLIVVEGCSHALLMEKPQEVARLVQDWLDDQARQAWLAEGAEAPDQITR